MTVREQLLMLAGARICFGHQSVGANLLEGLASLGRESSAALCTLPLTSGTSVRRPTLNHLQVGRNGDPISKLEHFASALTASSAAPFDIALVKFCYVDIGARTNTAQLFARYRERMEAIGRMCPGTTLLHVTVPLRASGGVRDLVSPWLRRGDPILDNVRRNEFNVLLRSHYEKGAIFDLAAAESTAPDGSRQTFTRAGCSCEQLAAVYTDDGGHLNASGRRAGAIAMVGALAGALLQRRALDLANASAG